MKIVVRRGGLQQQFNIQNCINFNSELLVIAVAFKRLLKNTKNKNGFSQNPVDSHIFSLQLTALLR